MTPEAAPVVALATLRCDGCGTPEVVATPKVVALEAGSAPETALRFVIAREAPTRAWCLACARRLGWLEAPA